MEVSSTASLSTVVVRWLYRLALVVVVPLSLVGLVAVGVVVLSLAATRPDDVWEVGAEADADAEVDLDGQGQSDGRATASTTSATRQTSTVTSTSPQQQTQQQPSLKRRTSKLAVRKQKSLSAQVSATVSDAAVRAAILLKQSPIPDYIAKMTSSTVVGYTRVDSAFGLHDRVSELSQKAVKGGIAAASIAATAALKAGVAYQTTPSYKELHGFETDDSEDEGFSSLDDEPKLRTNQLEVFESSQNGTQRVLTKRGRRRKNPLALARKSSSYSLASASTPISAQQYPIMPDGPCVRIVKLDTSIPGCFPQIESVESSTSTDPYVTGLGNLADESEACRECGRVGSYRSTPFNDYSQFHKQLSTSPDPSPTLFGTLYSTGTTVAGRVVTASSTYFLGKETTDILLGTNEPSQASQTGPMTKEEAFIQQATEEARAVLAASPIRTFCVGGTFVATSLRTLMRARGSKLKKWFTGIDGKCEDLDPETVKEWMRDGVMMRDGTFFIDRDGTHFSHIINHLRGLALSPSLDSRSTLLELRQEALFYNIVPLLVEIDERLMCVEMIEEDEIRDLEKALKRMENVPKEAAEVTVVEEPVSPTNVETVSVGNSRLSSRRPSPERRSLSPELVSTSVGTSNTVSPEPKPSPLEFSTVEMTTPSLDPVMSEGIRQRKPTDSVPAPPTDQVKPATPIPATTSLYALPTTATLFSLASSFLAPQQKSFVVANPDGGNSSDDEPAPPASTPVNLRSASPQRKLSIAAKQTLIEADEDTFVQPTTRDSSTSTTAVSSKSVGISAKQATKESGTQSAPESQSSGSWEDVMTQSHEETLHKLLTKRRQWRLQLELKGITPPTLSDLQRKEMDAILEAKEDGAPETTLIAKTVQWLNKATWNRISVFNAKRIQQGNVFTAYTEGGAQRVVDQKALEMSVWIERELERVGVLCGMPPPPRNDLLMNFAWAAGCGFSGMVQIGVVFAVVWLLM